MKKGTIESESKPMRGKIRGICETFVCYHTARGVLCLRHATAPTANTMCENF